MPGSGLAVAIGRRLPPGVKRTVLTVRRTALRGPVGTAGQRVAGRRVLHCFGDSNVGVFREIRRQRLLPRTWLDVTFVPGATAFGLANTNSATNALVEFRQAMERIPGDRSVLFVLGRVDCGYLIWRRAQRHGLAIEEQRDLSLANYTGFLGSLVAEGRRTIMVAAVPMPTVSDGQPWPEAPTTPWGARVTLVERTALARSYNAALRTWCTGHDCRFLDYEPDFIDPATGVVRDALRHPDPMNSHVAAEPFALILARHLKAAGFA